MRLKDLSVGNSTFITVNRYCAYLLSNFILFIMFYSKKNCYMYLRLACIYISIYIIQRTFTLYTTNTMCQSKYCTKENVHSQGNMEQYTYIVHQLNLLGSWGSVSLVSEQCIFAILEMTFKKKNRKEWEKNYRWFVYFSIRRLSYCCSQTG